MDKREMALLQGFEDSMLSVDMLKVAKIKPGVCGTMLGNTMSINVLCNVFPRLFLAGGFATEAEAARMRSNSGW